MSKFMQSVLRELTPCELQILLDTSDSYCDVLRKLDLNPKGGNPKTLKKIIKEYGLDETKLNQNRLNLYSRNSNFSHESQTIPLDKILNNEITKPYASAKLLKRLIQEGYKEYKCEKCGLSQWLGQNITLQLNHINGNHNDNRLENLEILCPNCHSQTDTFAGKNVDHSENKRRKRIQKAKKIIAKALPKLPPVKREDLKKLIRTTSFVEIGKQFGVSDNAIRKWCDKYKLPRRVSEIRKLTNEEWENI